MTAALAVLVHVRSLGIGIFLAGTDRIRLEFPENITPPEWVKARLTAHKPAIIRILTTESFCGRHVIALETYRPSRFADPVTAFRFDDEPFPLTLAGTLPRNRAIV